MAVVEFALTVPLLLFLYLGSVEVSQLITADRKVTIIAGTMGDLVARTNGSISTSTTLSDYFKAAERIIAPYSSEKLKQVVSCLYVDDKGVARVRWSEPYNGGTAHEVNTVYALPPEMVAISKESYVIVAEASFPYSVMDGLIFDKDIPLYRENFYIPRFGNEITLAN